MCDYHGQVIPQREGEKMMDKLDVGMCYLFFFKGTGGVKLCIDAQTFPCECHPQKDTFGRQMNCSGKNFNVRPVHFKLKFPDGPRDTILFLATRDIKCNEELLWDYGVRRTPFKGEGLNLEWLDERGKPCSSKLLLLHTRDCTVSVAPFKEENQALLFFSPSF